MSFASPRRSPSLDTKNPSRAGTSRNLDLNRNSDKSRPVAARSSPRSQTGSRRVSLTFCDAEDHQKATMNSRRTASADFDERPRVKSRRTASTDFDERPRVNSRRTASTDFHNDGMKSRLYSRPTVSTQYSPAAAHTRARKPSEDSHSPSPTTTSPTPSPNQQSPSTRIRPDLADFAGCIDPANFGQEEETEDVPRGHNRTNNYFHRPSSVARFAENADVAEFIAWVERGTRGWDNIHSYFAKEAATLSGDQHMHRDHQRKAGLSKRKWVSLMTKALYPNEAGLHTVWDEVAKELNTDKPEKGMHTMARMENTSLAEAEITLPQFKRFERRVCAVNAVLSPSDENSPARRFVKWLREKYGSSLAAWRRMLDVHSTGRVAYPDFLSGCRNMGVGAQGMSVWSNLKNDKGQTMVFHELDPEEGGNLQEFAKVLWDKTELDMNKAWMQMDAMNQKYLTLEQFKAGCEAFGWRGKAKMLFKGLESSGCGRLKLEDFRYICKGSHIGVQLSMANQRPVAALISWCNKEVGGLERLLELVGFYGKQELKVEELAGKLESLGFYGNAKEAATKAAQQPQGLVVTAASLTKLINGKHCKHDDLGSSTPTFRSSPSRSMVEHRFGWDGAVDDFALHNARRNQHTRGYFSNESKMPITRKLQADYAPNVSSPRPGGWESPNPRSQSASRGGSLGQSASLDPTRNSKYTGDFSDKPPLDSQRNRTRDIAPSTRSNVSSGSPRDVQQNRTRDTLHSSRSNVLSRSPRDVQRSGTPDTTDKVPAYVSKYGGDFASKSVRSECSRLGSQ